MTQSLQDRYDVVVIGAGMAGLACGALCARDGLRVLVAERHTKFGGYNQYFGKEPTFDSTFHFGWGGGPGGWVHDLLVDAGLDPAALLIPLDPAYRLLLPDYDLIVPPDADEFAGLLATHFPAEVPNLHRLLADLRAMGAHYLDLAPSPTPQPDAERAGAAPLSSEEGVGDLLARYADATAHTLLSDYVLDPRLQAILTGLWPFHGLPPERLSALDFVKGWHLLFHLGRPFTIRGGARELGAALAGVVGAHFGHAVTRSRVRRILIEDGRAVAVQFDDGLKVAAGAVVSTADPYQLWWEMVGSEHVPPETVEQLRSWAPSISAMIVHLQVAGPLDLPAHTTVVHSSYDHSHAFLDSFHVDPGFETFVVTQLDREDPERVAPGHNLVDVMSPMPFHRPGAWGGHATSGRVPAYRMLESYAAVKNRLADRLMARAVQVVPALAQPVAPRKVATPLTLERYTWAYQGAAFGWANTPFQAGPHRPGLGTPIRGLYLAGHWCFPGSGVPAAMMSGRLAARAVLAAR